MRKLVKVRDFLMATLGHHTLHTFVLTEMCPLPPQC